MFKAASVRNYFSCKAEEGVNGGMTSFLWDYFDGMKNEGKHSFICLQNMAILYLSYRLIFDTTGTVT